jgi:hypothetical protein
MSFSSPDDSQFKRSYPQEVKMLFSAMDCVLHGQPALYSSSELTSGLHLYKVLRAEGLKTATDLRKQKGAAWFQANLWDVNVQSAIQFAENVRGILHDRTIVITPAPFSALDWDQPQYLSFWEDLIRTRVKLVWFNRNWEYSNGCTFEFAVAQDAGLPTFDHHGNPLDARRGVELIMAAIHKLEPDGFDVTKLQESVARLQGRT